VSAPFTPDDAIAWVARYVEGWQDGSRAGFAIEDEAGTFLGFCALVKIDAERREAEIGYITAPEARGRGIGRRMLRLITEWALADLELERVELRIDVANPASAKMAERVGFQNEGTLRNVYFKDDRRIDLMIYSCLRPDLT
jgi:RimJ/RimL family protein N-acetyltransferase